MFGSLLVPAKAVILNLLQPVRHVRRDGVDLPAGPPVGRPGLHRDRQHRRDHPDPDVLHRVRAVDGLRGLPARRASRRSTTSACCRARPISWPSTSAPSPGVWSAPGRIVTAAAALLAVVFIAFAFSDIIFIKMLGIGMALAVLMDATLVRGALVPAFMKLAGRANWWAPGAAAPHPRALRHPRAAARRASRRRRSWSRDVPRQGTERRARARRGEGEHLREEILEAATRLVAETGSVDAVSMRMIADAVGVSPPSLYLHFADKSELVFACCDAQFSRLARARHRGAGRGRAAAGALPRPRPHLRRVGPRAPGGLPAALPDPPPAHPRPRRPRRSSPARPPTGCWSPARATRSPRATCAAAIPRSSRSAAGPPSTARSACCSPSTSTTSRASRSSPSPTSSSSTCSRPTSLACAAPEYAAARDGAHPAGRQLRQLHLQPRPGARRARRARRGACATTPSRSRTSRPRRPTAS